MEFAVVLASFAAAVLIAVVYFGIIRRSDDYDEWNPIINMVGVRRYYEKCLRSTCKCSVIYISIFSEKLRIKSEDTNAVYRFTEKSIVKLCENRTGKSARVDGNNYIIATMIDEDQIKQFTESFYSELGARFKGLDISIGVYMSEEHIDFRMAIGYAKKIARQAGERKRKYYICNRRNIKSVLERDDIQKNIESFIDNDEFYQLYQPFVDTKTGRVIGGEALTRLDNEKHTGVTPNRFMDAIKTEHLNIKFDLYVYRKCCLWAAQRARHKPLVTCNFSRFTLCEPEIADKIIKINNDIGAETDAVASEVIEDCVVKDFETLKNNILSLKKAGFKICLDDFGKAYSSLGDIARLLPDIIKIDKSILHEASDEQGEEIFKEVVHFAKKISKTVLCEGVETKHQAELAAKAGCDVLQGFYFYKPMKTESFDRVLDSVFETSDSDYKRNIIRKINKK